MDVPFLKFPVTQNCGRHGHFFAQGFGRLRGTVGIDEIDKCAPENDGEDDARFKRMIPKRRKPSRGDHKK